MGKKLLKFSLYSFFIFVLLNIANTPIPQVNAKVCSSTEHSDSCLCGGDCLKDGGESGCCANGTTCTSVVGGYECRPPLPTQLPSSGSCPTGQFRVQSPLDELKSACCPIGSCNGNTVTRYYFSTFASGCASQTYACPANTTCGLGSSGGYTCLPIPPTAVPSQPPEDPTSTPVPPTSTPTSSPTPTPTNDPTSTPTSTPPVATPTLTPTCDPDKTGDSAGKVDNLDFLWWKDEFLGVATKTDKLSDCLQDDVIDIFDFNKLRDLSFFSRLSVTAP